MILGETGERILQVLCRLYSRKAGKMRPDWKENLKILSSKVSNKII